MIRIERALYKDLGHLTAGEIATQEFPMTLDEAKPYVMDKGRDAYVAKLSSRVVGHALVTIDESNKTTLIDSIGVNPLFRKVGVGRKMMETISLAARAAGDSLKIKVASYLVDDKEDPWNIEGWLWKMGFKAANVETDGCFRYGRNYDLYVFEKLK